MTPRAQSFSLADCFFLPTLYRFKNEWNRSLKKRASLVGQAIAINTDESGVHHQFHVRFMPTSGALENSRIDSLASRWEEPRRRSGVIFQRVRQKAFGLALYERVQSAHDKKPLVVRLKTEKTLPFFSFTRVFLWRRTAGGKIPSFFFFESRQIYGNFESPWNRATFTLLQQIIRKQPPHALLFPSPRRHPEKYLAAPPRFITRPLCLSGLKNVNPAGADHARARALRKTESENLENPCAVPAFPMGARDSRSSRLGFSKFSCIYGRSRPRARVTRFWVKFRVCALEESAVTIYRWRTPFFSSFSFFSQRGVVFDPLMDWFME